MNGYVALWSGKRVEVQADTSYAAQCLAVAEFAKGTRRKVNGYDVTVVLAERGGVAVVHAAGE